MKIYSSKIKLKRQYCREINYLFMLGAQCALSKVVNCRIMRPKRLGVLELTIALYALKQPQRRYLLDEVRARKVNLRFSMIVQVRRRVSWKMELAEGNVLVGADDNLHFLATHGTCEIVPNSPHTKQTNAACTLVVTSAVCKHASAFFYGLCTDYAQNIIAVINCRQKSRRDDHHGALADSLSNSLALALRVQRGGCRICAQ